MPSPSEYLKAVKLPVMSEVAHLLIQTLHDQDASVTRVRDVIAKDAALTTTLVRMANSAMYGLSRSIGSLDHAISVVGMSQIRARALSICLTDVFPTSSGLDRTAFWQGSMACAGYAKYLAGMLGMDEQQAWLTGVMLRLGEPIIAQRDPALIEAFERAPRKPGERWARQRDALGFDECQLTSELAKRWDFPAEIVSALNAAAQPMAAQPFSALGAVLHLAGMLADSLLAGSLLADNLLGAEPLAVDLPKDVLRAVQLDGQAVLAKLPDPQDFTELPHERA